ncbi:MAG: TnsD family Tn7-like transposition protein [Hylemonella sp.]|nr:TnsD family Tn7-like transposition protein [Hylemonella sp.]
MRLTGFSYAPPLLPDELLYSWLSRFSLLNALGTPRECMERLFACRTIVPGIDLPTRLQSVQRQLGEWLPFQTVDQILDFGTLFPYHRPFLTSHRHDTVRHALIYGDGKGLKTQMGRIANRFGANPSLRFCAKCVEDSIAHYGSPYWDRRHQLPGVSCCIRHRIQLQRQPPLSQRTDRQRFVVLANWNAAQPHIRACERQLRFAELSEALLSATLPVIDASKRASIYLHAALKLGFETHRGRFDCSGLAEAVRQRFEDFHGFEHRERLLTSSAHPLGWIRDLIKRPERSVHPICHLLLIEFLFGSISSFATACSITNNGMTAIAGVIRAQQVRPPSSTLLQTISDTEREALLCDSSLSCRQVASLIGKSVTTVVVQRRMRGIPIRERRKSLNNAGIEKVRAELRSGDPLPVVAIRSSVSLSTVYRILAQYPSDRQPNSTQNSTPKVTERRQRWLSTMSAQEHAGVNAIRAAAPADYAWLYRHDRAWLMSTTKPIKKLPESGTRIDWAQRDAELSQKAMAYAATLRNQSSPTRVTKTRLLRPLGESMVRKNVHRLPLLDGVLERMSETHANFRRRRVDRAIAMLASSAAGLQMWRVKRLSGLRIWSDELSNYANKEIERLNAQNSVCTNSLP